MCADEALWLAQIHPLRSADSLDRDEVARLHAAIIAALDSAIARRGTTLVNYRDATGAEGENQHHLNAYGRTGKPCPRCGAPIERIVVAQRDIRGAHAIQPLAQVGQVGFRQADVTFPATVAHAVDGAAVPRWRNW